MSIKYVFQLWKVTTFITLVLCISAFPHRKCVTSSDVSINSQIISFLLLLHSAYSKHFTNLVIWLYPYNFKGSRSEEDKVYYSPVLLLRIWKVNNTYSPMYPWNFECKMWSTSRLMHTQLRVRFLGDLILHRGLCRQDDALKSHSWELHVIPPESTLHQFWDKTL